MSSATNFLDSLPTAERAEIEALFRRATFEAGVELFPQGAPADTAMWIREGIVQLELELPGEQRLEMVRLGPGEVFGELALVRPTTRSLRAEALSPVVVDVLERQDFQGLRHALRPSSFSVLLEVARRMASLVISADTLTRSQFEPAEDGAFEAAPLGTSETPGCSFDPRPFMDRLPFFARFSPSDREALLELGTLWQLPRGRTLIAEGDEMSGIFVVVRGAVEILARPGEPRLALIGPGALVGALSPLMGQAPIATCRMREAGTVLQLDTDALDVLLRPARRLSYRFLDALCHGLLDDVARADRVLARVEGARKLGLT